MSLGVQCFLHSQQNESGFHYSLHVATYCSSDTGIVLAHKSDPRGPTVTVLLSFNAFAFLVNLWF